MRRIALWLLSTVAAVVLLLSYRTSTMGRPGATAASGSGHGTTRSVRRTPHAGGRHGFSGLGGADPLGPGAGDHHGQRRPIAA